MKTCPNCNIKEDYVEESGNKMNFLNPDSLIPCRIKSIMEERKCCYSCAFWFEKMEIFPKDKSGVWCIIDGQSYFVHPGNFQKGNGFLGFGGSQWYIVMNDNRIIASNNVWHQGSVPECFRKDIPDNARLLTFKEYTALCQTNIEK